MVERFGSPQASQAIENILQPLAQLMVSHSVQLGEITEMLKKALVNAAVAHSRREGKDITDSRIAIITGVHRKDVRRLQQTPAESPESSSHEPMMSVGAQVVARWISEQRYINSKNKALPLARTPRHAKPGEPDFTSLVAEVSTDVGARAVLDELLRLGIVALQGDTHLQLLDDAFVPQEGLAEQFHFLSVNVSDHLATAVHNLQPRREGKAMLEQSAFAQNLSIDDAAELESTARHLWAQALQQFLQKATVAERRSVQKSPANQRVRYGVYFHQTAMPQAAQRSKSSVKKSAPADTVATSNPTHKVSQNKANP